MDKRYLKARVGNLEQIIYARKAILRDGKGTNLKTIDIDNGGYITGTILESRGLDLGQLKYKGVNIGFVGKPGFVAPSFTSVLPGEFTRYFQGGMLYTCGLKNIGPNYKDETGEYPLHGRLGMTPAKNTNINIDWEHNYIHIIGDIELAALFGSDLILQRSIKIPFFSNEIMIEDKVENQGFKKENIMLLYHINFGWPMLSKDTKLEIKNSIVEPRDSIAKKGISNWNTFEEPIDNYSEQVFYHTPQKEKDNLTHINVSNKKIKLGMEITYDSKNLPQLIEWKSMGSGDYALGIEPATSRVGGKIVEEKEGRVIEVEGGQVKTFKIKLKIHEL